MTDKTLARWAFNEIGTLDRVAFRSALPDEIKRPLSLTFWWIATQANRKQVLLHISELLAVYIENDTLCLDIGQQTIVTACPTLYAWHHGVITLSDAGRFYVDGQWIGEQGLGSDFTLPNDAELQIGGYTDAAGGHFDHTFGRQQSGWVDDVCLFDHVLTEADIQAFVADNTHPIAEFSYHKQADGTLVFRATSSNAMQSYLWDFGDGSSGIGQQVVHDYAFAGDYGVRLMAITASHQQTTTEQTISVDERPDALDPTPVFVNGTEGYACFRIPAIVRAKNGDLVAFAEGRVESCSDSTSTVRMVCKRSQDNGKTWSPVIVVARHLDANGEHAVQNGSPVVEQATGRIFVLYNKLASSEWDLAEGKGASRCGYSVSDDHGVSWHSDTDITEQVQHPDWRVQRPALGHAIQLHSGRLLVAGMFTEKDRSVFQSQNYVFWSDDQGATWEIGGILPFIGLNEATAAERDDGSIIINSRAYIDEVRAGKRAITIGHFHADGSLSLETTTFDETLIDSAVQASLLAYPMADGKRVLLFANPADPSARYNLTLRASYDSGQSWAISKTIDPGPSAYSDLVIQDDGQIGILYERGNHGGIAYVSVTMEWLTDSASSNRPSSEGTTA
ncbi:MAG: hypothetical protein CL607_07535 [Anaerolineaceae bacterium]|nr:hypothetical protein [Anaerolineaceae bacterium]